MKKIICLVLSLLFVAIAMCVYVFLSPLMPIITGYPAKNLASAVFVSERDVDSAKVIDLSFSPIKFTSKSVNYEEKSVTARFLWAKSKAVYREDVGVVLLRGDDEDKKEAMTEKLPIVKRYSYDADTVDWPMGDVMPEQRGISEQAAQKLDSISNSCFADGYGGTRFSLMVLHKGVPVLESYKDGINEDTKLLSWSMAKSVVNAMVGVKVGDGDMDVYAPADVDDWKDDDRAAITLDDLMRMQSGLEWNENYGNESDVNLMLHAEKDMAEFVYEKPLVVEPGKDFVYSSGSTNLVSYLIRKNIACDSTYYDLAYNRLLGRIGVQDPVLETDMSGTLVGSSYFYMTTRDYARFGLLYLQDGVFNGERILPEGWVEYTTTPSIASKGSYGSFFWTNKSGFGKNYLKDAPQDLFSCNGHDGQFIFVIPSEDLVIVTLGFSHKPNELDKNRLVSDIIYALK